MELIQVDPKLFITCRLCLEEMGQYQIVPSVQEKIKYCFDIDVKPFDGLPQLICDKCNKILTNVAQWKQTFTEKQQNLIIKAIKSDQKNVQPVSAELDNIATSSSVILQPQQDTVSSSQQVVENNECSKSSPKNKLKRLSNYTSDEDNHEIPHVSLKKQKKENNPFAWKRNYKRKLVCKICNSSWTNKKMLSYHYKRNHINLRQKYMSILNNFCFVKLKKIDDKPNFTGQSNMVVFDNNRILEEGNNKYYILYSKEQSTNYSQLTTQDEYSKVEPSSSDDEITAKPKKMNKKRRLVSRSSTETVVIGSSKIHSDSDDDSKSNTNVKPSINVMDSQDQCINIDDSSASEHESSSKQSDTRTKQVNEASFNDYKVIQGIISMCVKSYENKNELTETDTNSKKTDTLQSSTESQLKHKIISIGRKVITKQGFNCTGLLRYLEYKNLEIVWIRKQSQFGTNENFIRILTKIRDAIRDPSSHSKWTKVFDEPQYQSMPIIEDQVETSNTVNEAEDSAVIYCNPSGSELKKILNENPVANPKQLPKKPCAKNKDEIICMPIITSTTSLATNPDTHSTKKTDSIVTTGPVEPAPPRIKVKSAAELMSDKPLCRFDSVVPTPDANSSNNIMVQVENVWPPQNAIYVSPPPQITFNLHNSNITSEEIGLSVPASTRESVTLDTIELPNTRTDSPYTYIKNLLQLHNLLLKHPMENLSHDFFCLVKFKVLFNQDSTEQPVVLCLSLFALNNTFCLKLKDQKEKSIDINKLSANWQWEILQIYRGELVIRKALQNAQRVNQETHDFTNNFLCVLKSVKKLS